MGDDVPGATIEVGDGAIIEVGSLKLQVLQVPCHTRGHIIFYIEHDGKSALITGDTLFIAGCGRFFQGTAAQMELNLNHIIASLPDSTLIYPGHEYTISNFKFALHVEPHNQAVQTHLRRAEDKREAGLPTYPSTIGEEKSYNPFMRTNQPSVIAFCKGASTPSKVMEFLRNSKNHYRG
jgi:hydroxyacylglutathione hydrolase